MLGLFEEDSNDSAIQLKVTEKGTRVINGIKSILGLESDYEDSKEEIDEELEMSSGKSLSQILQDDRIKEAKKKFLKEKV